MQIHTVGPTHEWKDHEVEFALDYFGVAFKLSFVILKGLFEELSAIFVGIGDMAFEGFDELVAFSDGADSDV